MRNEYQNRQVPHTHTHTEADNQKTNAMQHHYINVYTYRQDYTAFYGMYIKYTRILNSYTITKLLNVYTVTHMYIL